MAVNGVYIVQGEMNQVVMMLRKSKRWQLNAQVEDDPILRNFADLRDVLNSVNDLSDMTPNTFLSPFLEVIRSDHTTGPVTGVALSSIGKFLSYGLIDASNITAASAVENVAEAVTHARFVGTDPSNDEVVLLRIIEVLRTLLLTAVGSLLTNESVLEIMQSCFRICFEGRLSQLLRKAAEHALSDMIQLLFTRLPTFQEDPRHPYIRKLQMKASDPTGRPRRRTKYKNKNKPPIASSSDDANRGVSAEEAECKLAADNSSLEPNTNGETESSIAQQQQPYRDLHSPTSDLGSSEALNLNSPSDGMSLVVDVAGNLGFGCAFDEAHSASGEDDDMITKYDVETPCSAVAPSLSEFNAATVESLSTTGVTDLQGSPATTIVAVESSTSDEQSIAIRLTETECVSSSERGITTGEEQFIEVTSESAYVLSADREHTSDEDEPTFLRHHVPESTFRKKTTAEKSGEQDGESLGPLAPYGLPCIRELFRFLISLIDPLDSNNTDNMIAMGLNLVTVAFEAGADHLGNYSVLMPLIKNELCRSLFLLLGCDKLAVFACALRLCFLLFESLRTHLKLQLEMYFSKLMDIVVSENPKVLFEQREIALDALVQLWRIPGLVTELYLNYDCDLYCSNLFEEMTKLLSKNAFPLTGLRNTHILSLDALLTVVDTIESNCHYRMVSNRDKVDTTKAPLGLSKELNTGVVVAQQMLPPASGFTVAKRMSEANIALASPPAMNFTSTGEVAFTEAFQLPQIRPNRMVISANIPTHEDLIAQKKKKRLLWMGTDLFNQSPSKGIAFLQEHGLFQTPLNPEEVVEWLRENPRLDKKLISDYICNRKNSKVLEAFVKSFNFEAIRIDDALRMFLESFRLPGEAPVISMLIEHFAAHWHTSNEEPFANNDAAFTLTYAVIMLNVDQHNTNAKKQNIPMTPADFKKNLTKVNGGEDFDEDLLEDIYNSIKNEEIVMPAEHTGIVRDNYLWKVLLKRGIKPEGRFIHSPSGLFDHDLFSLIWGPTVAAISYVFDKSIDDSIVRKALSGFRKCAAISAHYGMNDVFDNLIISLCKFSMLMASSDNPDYLPVVLGENLKAQMAVKTLFQLVHTHGDILREGWKNIFQCMVQLYRAKMLPRALIEVEDFVSDKGIVSIIREKSRNTVPKSESGIFSSLYSYFGSDGKESKGPTVEEQELMKIGHGIIGDCHVENIVLDSKYLTTEALAELIKAIVLASSSYCGQDVLLSDSSENAVVFFLELLVAISLENKDRLVPYWSTIKNYVCSLMTVYRKNVFLVERAVTGILRLAIRLLFREEIAEEVLRSLDMLLLLRASDFARLSRHIAFGLLELLRTNAANIHRKDHWRTLFLLLECAGGAAFPERRPTSALAVVESEQKESHSDVECTTDRDETARYDTDRGYTSDSEVYDQSRASAAQQYTASSNQLSSATGSAGIARSGSQSGSNEWMYVDHEGSNAVAKQVSLGGFGSVRFTKASILLRKGLKPHDQEAFWRCCDALQFLVRDAAHITPDNFESCVQSLRTFVEAAVDGGNFKGRDDLEQLIQQQSQAANGQSQKDRTTKRVPTAIRKGRDNASLDATEGKTTEQTEATIIARKYLQTTLQLLDLTDTLHFKGVLIYKNWAQSDPSVDASPSNLWRKCWCPLLQASARLCCDVRKEIRTAALTYLQRALLSPDLQQLSSDHWEDCFRLVLFPLLSKLLDNIGNDPISLEETRVRATTTLLCKVFLQHLTPLYSLQTFPALWITILDFMEKYLRTGSDHLTEAIPESLKNMLKVMDTTPLFADNPKLYQLSHERLSSFLPNLLEEALPEEHRIQYASGASNANRGSSSIQPDAIGVADAVRIDADQTGTTQMLEPVAAVQAPLPVHPPFPLEEVVVDRSQSPMRYRATSPSGSLTSPPPENVVRILSAETEIVAAHIVLHPPADQPSSHVILHPPANFQPSGDCFRSYAAGGSSMVFPSYASEDHLHSVQSHTDQLHYYTTAVNNNVPYPPGHVMESHTTLPDAIHSGGHMYQSDFSSLHHSAEGSGFMTDPQISLQSYFPTSSVYPAQSQQQCYSSAILPINICANPQDNVGK